MLLVLLDLQRHVPESDAIVHVPDLGVAGVAVGLCGWQAVDAAAAAAVDHILEHRADGGGLILVGDGAGVVLVAEE